MKYLLIPNQQALLVQINGEGHSVESISLDANHGYTSLQKTIASFTPDSIIVTSTRLGSLMDVFRAKQAITGSTKVTDALSNNVAYGLASFAACSIPNVNHVLLHSNGEKLEQVSKKGYVFCPVDAVGLDDEIVCRDWQQLLLLTSLYHQRGGDSYVLRDIVDDDTLWITSWFNGRDFYLPTASSINYHLYDNMGPVTNMPSCLTWGINKDNQLFIEMQKAKKLLHLAGYRGPVSIRFNGGLAERWYASYLPSYLAGLSELLQGSLADLIYTISRGEKVHEGLRGGYGMSVGLSIPPFPYEGNGKGMTVFGVEKPALKHLWLDDVVYNNGVIVIDNAEGRIGYVTARGDNPEKARWRVKRTISRLDCHGLQYNLV